jgi:hypothetical protein
MIIEPDSAFLLVTTPNLALLIGWPALSLISMFALRTRPLSPTTKAVWVLIVVAVPILGAVSFFIIQPREDAVERNEAK